MGSPRMRFGLLILLSLAGLEATARADVIKLRNGETVEGTIVEESDEAVSVQISQYGIKMTKRIRRSEIVKITKGPAGEGKQQDEGQSEEDKEDAEDRAASKKRVPVEVDLQMALNSPLIYDTFQDGRENVELRGTGYFVLVPFRYDAAEKPYRITRYTLKFDADRGTSRARGFVELQEKQTGGRGRPAVREREATASEGFEGPVQLEPVKGSPLYEKITVYGEGGEDLMVELSDRYGPTVDTGKDTTNRSRRSTARYSGRRSRRGGRSSRRSSHRSLAARRSPGRRQATEEKRGYEKRGYERAYETDTDPESKTEGDKTDSREERRFPEDAVPGSGWAAVLVELPNKAAMLTVIDGMGRKIPIDLRLIDALQKTQSGATKRGQADDSLRYIQTLAEFVQHESSELSRLAISRLTEMRSVGSSSPRGRGTTPDDAAVADQRSVFIENALLTALTSPDEETREIAWWELVSAERLPQATAVALASVEDQATVDVLLKLIEEEIKAAAKAVPSPSVQERDRPREPARRAAARARGRQEKDEPALTYTPRGLAESAAPPGLWNVLGALMRSSDSDIATKAVSLALIDGSRQAISLLGQPDPRVSSIAIRAMREAPNTPAKGQCLRMILSGVANKTDPDKAPTVLQAAMEIARGMATAGKPIQIAHTDDLLMRLPVVLKDTPNIQVLALSLLAFTSMEDVLNSPEIETWLGAMTDKLVAAQAQAATYQLVASKWMPKRLLGLGDLGQAPAPAGAAPPAAARGGRSPRAPRGRRATPKPPSGKPGSPTAIEPQGPIETFLVQGMQTRPEPAVQAPIVMALLRVGRAGLVLAHHQAAGQPEGCASLLKFAMQMAAQWPPTLEPCQASRFTPLGLVMEAVKKHEATPVLSVASALLSRMVQQSTGDQRWRYAFALKRSMKWESTGALCANADSQAAEQVREALGIALNLAEGEQDALAGITTKGQVITKLREYDKQRGGKIDGTYHGFVTCRILLPDYDLQYDAPAEPQAKERSAKIVNLTWREDIVSVYPDPIEVTVDKERNIAVKLGAVQIGSGKALTPKDSKPAAAPKATPPTGAQGKNTAIARRLAQLKKGAPVAKAPEQESRFDIDLVQFVAAMVAHPSTRGKVPVMLLPPPSAREIAAKARGAAKTKTPEETDPKDLLRCPMTHLSFGTRQGSMQLGGDKPPELEGQEVRVDANGTILRGARIMPICQEIQVFLEPAPEAAGG